MFKTGLFLDISITESECVSGYLSLSLKVTYPVPVCVEPIEPIKHIEPIEPTEAMEP